MKPAITFLGHGGLDIRLGSARVLCDPWLSGGGAYLGNWHPFPDNRHLSAADLHDAPILFFSSPRPDHFDLETLRAFPKAARVVIPAFPSRTWAEQIRQLGFDDLVELSDWQPLDLGGGTRLHAIASSTKHVLRAALVLEREGVVIVNQNDCQLDPATLRRLAESRPALHFIQVSGASYFPAVYDFSSEQMKEHLDQQEALIWRRFFEAAKGVGARYVLPSGPPLPLDQRGFDLGFERLFDAEDVLAKAALAEPDLTARLRILYPGGVAAGEAGDWRFDGRDRPYGDERGYLEAYRRDREPERQRQLAALRAQAAPVDAKELRGYLRDLFQFEDMTWQLGILVQVRLEDGPSVWVDFRKKPFRYLTECDEPANYRLTLSSDWMSLVLQGKLTWHELLMGHQVALHRDPDLDRASLMNHFDYRHDEALFDLVRRENPALITVQDEQMEYVCQRFCPHRGRDLEYATIERGVLTCTAHGWRFDLRRGGKCLWGGDAPLLVKESRPLKR
jgi:nitrite reductase/ring-hydroxylating ferredoxin subunit